MKKYSVDKIRNLGLISHGGAGKTTLAEAMLYVTGVITRLGKVDDGTATLDYDPEEQKRQISINTAVAPVPFEDFKINIVDTPGYFDFVGEVRAALRVTDGALVVVEAAAGVEVGTELVWGYADEYELPRLVLINKMDRENADFDRTLQSLREAFGDKVIPLHLPIGQEDSFKGIVDVLSRRAYIYEGDRSGKFEESEVPAELQDKVEEYREALIEAAAETDDELIMKYLEGEGLSDEEIQAGLRRAVVERSLFPVLCASGAKNIGVQPLLRAVTELLPSPADLGEVKGTKPDSDVEVSRRPSEDEAFSALVYKTVSDPYVGKMTLFRVYSGTVKSDSQVYNANKGKVERIGQLFVMRGKEQQPVDAAYAGDLVGVAKLQETTTSDTLCDQAHSIVFKPIQFPRPVFSVAVQPKAKGDEEKIGSGLARLMEEDPTFIVERNTETNQTILSGMGELHVEVITDRLKRKFGVEVNLTQPKVAYRETIKSTADVDNKYKKQTGGRGQYGHVIIHIEPLERGKEFEFEEKIFGGAVPRQYIPAVEKGIREAMQEGILAGYPVTDVKVTLLDGSYHSVDSSEMAFKIAASAAFKKGMQDANPVLLEPIMTVEVLVPEQFMGDVMGDLNKRRGKILGMEPRGTTQVIKALVPQAEMFTYAIDLRSITQGRGTYTMSFSHYEEVPAQVAEEVIEKARKAKEEEK